MSRTNTRFALAAVLAALSAPAFAGDAALSSVSGDPTWPAIENPAPAVAVHAKGGEAEALVRTDSTWPVTDNASPAIAVVAVPDDGGPQTDPVEEWEPTPSYAIELSAPKSERVATVR